MSVGPEWVVPDTWGAPLKGRPRLKAVTIPADLYALVVAEAERLGVPPAWVVARAVREALAAPGDDGGDE